VGGISRGRVPFAEEGPGTLKKKRRNTGSQGSREEGCGGTVADRREGADCSKEEKGGPSPLRRSVLKKGGHKPGRSEGDRPSEKRAGTKR